MKNIAVSAAGAIRLFHRNLIRTGEVKAGKEAEGQRWNMTTMRMAGIKTRCRLEGFTKFKFLDIA